MPPVLARKRLQSDSPDPQPPPKKQARTRKPPARRGKESVFETLNQSVVKRTLSQTKAFLEQDSDDSELSDLPSSEDDFEDVLLNGTTAKGKEKADSEESEDENWEDALGAQHSSKPDHGPTPVISGDIALTLSAAPKTAFDSKPDGKKGPSKVQRQIRNATHCMHVQCLMFHNLIRNAWIQDKEVQEILVESLSEGCWRELEQYWRDAGISDGPSRVAGTRRVASARSKNNSTEQKGKWQDTGKNGVKVYESPQSKRATNRSGKTRTVKVASQDTEKSDRVTRDWGATSERLEPNTPNLSVGDPLLRLLRYLSAYWKSKYKISSPSLRKRGYLSPSTLEAEIRAFRDSSSHPDLFGERIEDLKAFRKLARKCEGSRDVGQQLFTALVRGLGIEARMIVSLQPVGFGWSQSEEGKAKNLDNLKDDQDASDSSDLSSIISISSDPEIKPMAKKSSKARKTNEELPYPTYWTEAISHLTHTPVSVSPLPRIMIASVSVPEKLPEFYARGAQADRARQVLAYLIAFSSDGTAKDVTTRYLPKHQWPGRTKGFRMPVERIPIHNKRGKVKRWEEWDWFKSLMRSYARAHDKRRPWDEVEEEGDLVPAEPDKKKSMDEDGGKETLQGYKNSAEYVLERHLRREEALQPGAKIVRHFITGKGDSEKSEPVYLRSDIVTCKTAESWHKEGREIRTGEQPLKHVPMRAVTVTRKREIEERQREEGGKVLQGLYSKAQTEWIIPDPILDGKIPRNAFNNIDVYVPTMVPRGAVHIPLKGTARICRKLNIDYAEACTGFEFGKQRAVPVLTGVVVAIENEDLLIDAWEAEEAAKAKKEADKREKLVLGLWRKFCSGLRILERMKLEYGDDFRGNAEKAEPMLPKNDEPKNSEWEIFQAHQDFQGGFLRNDEAAGGFLAASQEEPMHTDLIFDNNAQTEERDRPPVALRAHRTPISLASAVQQAANDVDDGSDEETGIGTDNSQASSDDDKEEDEELTTKTSSQHHNTSKSRVVRGSKPSLGAKSSSKSTRKRKSLLVHTSEDEELPLSDAPSTTPRPLIRSTPRRKAAQKSDEQVKSHFFANGSEAETDLTDLTDRNSPQKKRVTVGGRGKGKVGRGTGSASRKKKGRVEE